MQEGLKGSRVLGPDPTPWALAQALEQVDPWCRADEHAACGRLSSQRDPGKSEKACAAQAFPVLLGPTLEAVKARLPADNCGLQPQPALHLWLLQVPRPELCTCFLGYRQLSQEQCPAL